MNYSDWTFDVKNRGQIAYVCFTHKENRSIMLSAEDKKHLKSWIGKMSELCENLFQVHDTPEIVCAILSEIGVIKGGNAAVHMQWFASEGYLAPPAED